MEGGVRLRDPQLKRETVWPEPKGTYTYHIAACIQPRAERGRQRGREGLATSRSPATRPTATSQASPSHCPSVLPSTEPSQRRRWGPEATLGSDTPRPAPRRAEAIKGLASVAGVRTRPGYGLTQ